MSTDSPIPKLVKVQDLAEEWGETPGRIYELIRAGILPSCRLGRQVRVPRDKLIEFINSGGKALSGGWRND